MEDRIQTTTYSKQCRINGIFGTKKFVKKNFKGMYVEVEQKIVRIRSLDLIRNRERSRKTKYAVYRTKIRKRRDSKIKRFFFKNHQKNTCQKTFKKKLFVLGKKLIIVVQNQNRTLFVALENRYI